MSVRQFDDDAQVGLVLGFIIVVLLQSWVFTLLTGGIGFGTVVVPMTGAVIVNFILAKIVGLIVKELTQ